MNFRASELSSNQSYNELDTLSCTIGQLLHEQGVGGVPLNRALYQSHHGCSLDFANENIDLMETYEAWVLHFSKSTHTGYVLGMDMPRYARIYTY